MVDTVTENDTMDSILALRRAMDTDRYQEPNFIMVQDELVEVAGLKIWSLSLFDMHALDIQRRKLLAFEDNMSAGQMLELRNVEYVIKKRQSTAEYLRLYFEKPDELLDAMLSCNVYLSGSRALDFIKGTKFETETDFDFFAESNPKYTYNFLKYTESIGVKWETIYDDFLQKIRRKSKKEDISETQIKWLYQHYTSNSLLSEGRDVFNELYIACADTLKNTSEYRHSMPCRVTVTVTSISGIEKEYTVHPAGYGGLSRFNVINGVYQNKNKEYSIQLIVSDTEHTGGSILDIIRTFDMSCNQCAITGFATFHMYASYTHNNECIAWNTEHTSSEGAIAKSAERKVKYANRGYSFPEVPEEYKRDPHSLNKAVRRTMGGPSVLVMHRYNGVNEVLNTGVSYPNFKGQINYRLQQLYQYTWIERIYKGEKFVARRLTEDYVRLKSARDTAYRVFDFGTKILGNVDSSNSVAEAFSAWIKAPIQGIIDGTEMIKTFEKKSERFSMDEPDLAYIKKYLYMEVLTR